MNMMTAMATGWEWVDLKNRSPAARGEFRQVKMADPEAHSMLRTAAIQGDAVSATEVARWRGARNRGDTSPNRQEVIHALRERLVVEAHCQDTLNAEGAVPPQAQRRRAGRSWRPTTLKDPRLNPTAI